MEASTGTVEDLRREIDRLVSAQRAACLWFTPRGYTPASDAERLAALRNIERYGDRAAYMEAREFIEWLLRVSNET